MCVAQQEPVEVVERNHQSLARQGLESKFNLREARRSYCTSSVEVGETRDGGRGVWRTAGGGRGRRLCLEKTESWRGGGGDWCLDEAEGRERDDWCLEKS